LTWKTGRIARLRSALGKLLLGPNGGMSRGELLDISFRSRFSEYLPWVAYDRDASVYLNSDNTVGLGWECSPLSFAGNQTENTLLGLFRAGLPEGSVMQFILYADDNVEPHIENFRETKKVRDNRLVTAMTEHMADYYKNGRKGFKNLAGIPLRHFRLFVTVKIPMDTREGASMDMNGLGNSIFEVLAGCGLNPIPLDAHDLVDWMRRLFNDEPSFCNFHYDENIPLRKQVIFSQTDMEKRLDFLRIGGKYFQCTTPKVFPREVNLFQTNQLLGGIWGLASDNDQIKLPFLYTLNIVFESLKSRLHTKCNMVLQQKAVGSFAPSLQRKQEEYLWATGKLDAGTSFVRVMPLLWVFGDDKKRTSEAVSRVSRIWESFGYVMQEDKGILPLLFLSALPLGLINKGKNVDNIDRDFIVPAESAVSILPIQGDFAGGSKPELMFVGRKGQVCGIDVFDKKAKNHNIFIAATSGSGKSFFVNYLASAYYGAGARIRIIDIGGSYRKTTSMFDAKYLDFSPASNVCLNPLSNIVDPSLDLPMVAIVLAQMAYSGDGQASPTGTEMTILENVANYVYRLKTDKRQENVNIDNVYEVLKDYGRFIKNDIVTDEIIETAKILAFNIRKFTSDGQYGRFFNGSSTLDIGRDDFVVLELEHLAQNPALFRVVTLQVVNLVTQNLYLSDRSAPIFIIFDEAHQFLKKSDIISSAIDTGYRRARKYGGSFSIITQSVLDNRKFGDVGEVIWGNSDFRFLMESVDFEKARNEKVIDYEPFIMDLLKSVKSNPPKYSEIFFDTPFGMGVGRLSVDPFSYYVFTSKAEEIASIESIMQKESVSYDEAIQKMVDMRHN